MKKYFFIAMAAVLGLAVASCKPEPEVSPLKIEVSDITGAGATVTVTCSTTDYFYWDVALPEDLAGYANPYEYWVNESMIPRSTTTRMLMLSLRFWVLILTMKSRLCTFLRQKIPMT